MKAWIDGIHGTIEDLCVQIGGLQAELHAARAELEAIRHQSTYISISTLLGITQGKLSPRNLGPGLIKIPPTYLQ